MQSKNKQYNLVVLPFHDWKKCEREGFRTRDAHFMQEFDKHPLVDKMLVINRPISISEMVLMRRNLKPFKGSVIYQEKNASITQVTSKTYTLDILVWEIIKPIRMKRWWIPYIYSQPEIARVVKLALSFLGMDLSYALFMSSPIYVPLVKNLVPPIFIFDALDNFLKHSFYRDMPKLEAYYHYCLDKANFVSANSKETTEWFQKYRADAIHIPNGVDDKIFNANKDYPLPEDMAALTPPIVGYAGKMQEMFDLSLMIQAVQEMPDIIFVFIGQQLDPNWMKPLWKYENVYYLGDKPYDILPRYLSVFDVCIIPYHVERQHGVDPIKFYEYLAMGKPIVTTNIGNVSTFNGYPQVCIAESTNAFVTGLKNFIAQIQKGVPIKKKPVPEAHLWRTKADFFLKQIASIYT